MRVTPMDFLILAALGALALYALLTTVRKP